MGKEGEKGGVPKGGKSMPRKEEASTSYQGKGTGRRKEVEESRGGRSGTCDQAMRSIARIEKKLNGRAQKESRGALWQRSAGGSTVTRIGMVHPRNNSDLQRMQRM